MDSLKEIIESILFVAGEAVEFYEIAEKLNIDIKEVKKATEELKKEKEDSFTGIQVQIFNDKAQLCSNPNYATFVSEVLNPIRERALTKAVLEVAAIIAYKQPITRLEIEQVRGVNSDYAVNVLIENNLIEVVGRKDAIGKPLLFSTTDLFLKRFNMETLEDLPDYNELLERIQVIRNPENSLFDFTNIPDSEKSIRDEGTKNDDNQSINASEDINILETVPSDEEFAGSLQLDKDDVESNDINELIDKLSSDNQDEVSLEVNSSDEELAKIDENLEGLEKVSNEEDSDYNLFDLI